MKPTLFSHCGVQKVIKIGKSYHCLECKTFFTKRAIELRQPDEVEIARKKYLESWDREYRKILNTLPKRELMS